MGILDRNLKKLTDVVQRRMLRLLFRVKRARDDASKMSGCYQFTRDVFTRFETIEYVARRDEASTLSHLDGI